MRSAIAELAIALFYNPYLMGFSMVALGVLALYLYDRSARIRQLWNRLVGKSGKREE